MAPSVVDLPLQPMTQSLHRGQLQTAIVAVCPGRKLSDRAKAGVGRLHVREGREASLAHGLIAINLREIGLVNGTSADVLSLHAGGRSELVLNPQTPLHEVRRVKCAIWHGRDGDGRQAGSGICDRRCTGKLSVRKARTKSLVSGHSRIDCAARYSL